MDNLTEKRLDLSSGLQEIATDFLNCIIEEFPEYHMHFAEKIEENVYGLLNTEKPQVMVYGIYNSGKSTLINALCKEEVAEVRNCPTTAQIEKYDHGDYILVDSPGVDAPIEHEQVTEEHLNKCHIILFVLSSKGIFEDRDNYKRLTELIEKDIPFIIVLNERGCRIEKGWTEEQKKEAKTAHENELKDVQHKIIQNLIEESHDNNIADKYEVIILDAKKSLKGVLEDKPRLYEAGKVEKLDKRITQILQNDATIGQLFSQPANNLKECLEEIEQIITQKISGNATEDFSEGLRILAQKKNNIAEELKVLTKKSVMDQVDSVTSAYVSGDSALFDSIAMTICADVEQRFKARIIDLYAYADKKFASVQRNIDADSDLQFETIDLMIGLKDVDTVVAQDDEEDILKEKKGLFDFLKSKKKKEREKMERLEHNARVQNEKEQKRLYETIRIKQEARQAAEADLYDLLSGINTVVFNGLEEKADRITNTIIENDYKNKAELESGKRQLEKVRQLRERLMELKNRMA